MGNLDLAVLRESIDLENRADLMALACRFGEATELMKRANKLRSGQFGKLEPNELRERTLVALS